MNSENDVGARHGKLSFTLFDFTVGSKASVTKKIWEVCVRERAAKLARRGVTHKSLSSHAAQLFARARHKNIDVAAELFPAILLPFAVGR
jgi:hypothetical protein